MKEKWVKMHPTLTLWEIIDTYAVKGYVQTFGYVVLVPKDEYERVLRLVKDKPIAAIIKNLTKKDSLSA